VDDIWFNVHTCGKAKEVHVLNYRRTKNAQSESELLEKPIPYLALMVRISGMQLAWASLCDLGTYLHEIKRLDNEYIDQIDLSNPPFYNSCYGRGDSSDDLLR